MRHTAPSFLLVLALTGSFLAGFRPALAEAPPATREVHLTGWLQTYDLAFNDVVVQIVLDGAERTTTVNDRGRFDVTLPLGVEAVLRFEKPGHVTKEVILDTRHADAGDFDQRVRKVEIGVVLEPDRHMAQLIYDGPVGSIGFDADGGCLAVEQHRRTTPARKSGTMEF